MNTQSSMIEIEDLEATLLQAIEKGNITSG